MPNIKDVVNMAFRGITKKGFLDIEKGNLPITKVLNKEMFMIPDEMIGYVNECGYGCCFVFSSYMLKILRDYGINTYMVTSKEGNGIRASVLYEDNGEMYIANPVEDIECFTEKGIKPEDRYKYYVEDSCIMDIAYFHGTNVNVCRLINETGLLYKYPSLNMTSVGQNMPFGQGGYCYSDFEGLLNWKHKEHKGLAIIAVPYESFYKTGLWSTFKESAYGFSYKINPEFIVGYIDVVNKKIVRNPQYKREHNYADLIPDMSIYRKQEGIDNIGFLNSMVDVDMSINGELSDSSNINENNIFDDVDLKVDTDQIVSVIDNFKMCFNSIALLESDEMSEERYKDLLNKISDGVSYISNILPLLESEEQKRDDSSTAFSMFK